jgi:hypothetical protein
MDVRSLAGLRNSLIPHGAGAGSRTRMSRGTGDFKPEQKGRRIDVYLIRRPVPLARSTRSALQSEDYGHPRGHLRRRAHPELRRNSTNELSDKPGAVQYCALGPRSNGESSSGIADSEPCDGSRRQLGRKTELDSIDLGECPGRIFHLSRVRRATIGNRCVSEYPGMPYELSR